MSVQSELESLREDDGLLRVEIVHDWADQNRTSEIGRRLDWDDASAAQQYRFSQIRLLVRIYIRDPDDNRRTTISLVSDRVKPGGGYRQVEAVFSHQAMREAALREALAELERIQDRYDYLFELAEVFEAAERARARAAPRARRRRLPPPDDRPTA